MTCVHTNTNERGKITQMNDIFSKDFDWEQAEIDVLISKKPNFYDLTHSVDYASFQTKYSFPQISDPYNFRMLIVPEPHISDKNRASRINYVDEMKCIFSPIEKAIEFYQPDDTLFMGEIFDRGFSSVPELCYWFDKFIALKTKTNVCSVKGNHEDSFYKNNPYWYLTGAGIITSPINRVIDGVALNYYHYGEVNTPVFANTTVGFSHDDVMTGSIRKALKVDSIFLKDMPTSTTSLFPNHDIVFNGHLHKLCTQLKIPRTQNGTEFLNLIYTGTLGRTNILEVNKEANECTVYLYILDIKDGNAKITPLPIELPNYDSVVNFKERNKYKEKTEHTKLKQMITTTTTRTNLVANREEINKTLNTNKKLNLFYQTIKDTSPNKILDALDSIFK